MRRKSRGREVDGNSFFWLVVAGKWRWQYRELLHGTR